MRMLVGRDGEEEEGGDARADQAADILDHLEVIDCPGDPCYGGGGENDHGRMPESEEETHGDGHLTLLHQLAGDVVDGGDMVGIDRVAQTQPVNDQRDAEQLRLVREAGKGPEPGSDVQGGEEGVNRDEPTAQAVRPRLM